MYSPRLALTIGFFSTRPGREPWERGWSSPLLWLGFTKAPYLKRTQHCWQQLTTLLDITCCVRLHTHPVACCLTKFETGQTLIDVQTDATTPNMLGQQCWEFLNINSGKKRKSGRDTVVLKFSFFLFFIPTEPVIWLVVLRSFRNQNNLLSTFFGLFGQASEARKDSGKLEFVYRKRGRCSANQKVRRLLVRGT